jgi:hypothetical protein
MVDQQHLLGRSRAQVLELLGEPDLTPYFRHYDMVYVLGRERPAFGLDSEWLVLRMPQGTVADARIVRTEHHIRHSIGFSCGRS